MQWSSPDMVDNIYDIYRICMGTTRCYLRNDCRILKQKNPSEGSDVSSDPQKSENSKSVSIHNASCCLDVFFAKRFESQRNNMLKTLLKCMTKIAEDSVKKAVTRKLDQHILLKVQYTDLAARKAHYHATCRRDYTREDDRHQETTKDTKTIEEQASNKTIYFQYIV